MVAVVTGAGLGLSGASSSVLGTGGQQGVALTGRGGEGVTVNARTGNLVVQHQDEFLAGRGLDVGVVRTYNSGATFDFDNNDGWQLSLYKKLGTLTGTFDSLAGRNPDYMSAELANKTVPGTIQILEMITGVSADTVLPGDNCEQISGEDGRCPVRSQAGHAPRSAKFLSQPAGAYSGARLCTPCAYLLMMLPSQVCLRRVQRRLHLLFVIIASLLTVRIASAIDIPEGTNKLQLATEINRRYVIPLGLEGRVAEQAIQIALGEGFRCDLEHVSPIGLNEPPLALCIKQPSGFGALCDDLILALRIEERVGGIASREELLHKLESLKVRSALTFCPYTPEVSPEYLAQRKTAEAELTRQVDSLDVLGNAKHTYEKFLLEGFYCGFTSDKASTDASESPKLVCTKRPSGIKFCFESKVVMNVEWPKGTSSIKQLFGRLNASSIKAVHSTCEIPAIKSNGAPL